jgi:hypothetical protein
VVKAQTRSGGMQHVSASTVSVKEASNKGAQAADTSRMERALNKEDLKMKSKQRTDAFSRGAADRESPHPRGGVHRGYLTLSQGIPISIDRGPRDALVQHHAISAGRSGFDCKTTQCISFFAKIYPAFNCMGERTGPRNKASQAGSFDLTAREGCIENIEFRITQGSLGLSADYSS